MEKLSTGKRPGGGCTGQQSSSPVLGPQLVYVAMIKSKATVIIEVGCSTIEMMLDSGSAVSLLRKQEMENMKMIQPLEKTPDVKLITASGEPLAILSHVVAPVQVGDFKTLHHFVAVDCLIYPVILGIDFLHKNKLTLDFSSVPVGVTRHDAELHHVDQVKVLWHNAQDAKGKQYAAAILEDSDADTIDKCSIPNYGDLLNFDVPQCRDNEISMLLQEYKDLFRCTPGVTNLSHHHIPTTGNPIRIPPQKIPTHYKKEGEDQIQQMLRKGVISSPWMAPAIFVRKKSGEIRLCVDYRELNKKTQKDAYPLPLPDEVQDKLAGATVFTTLDLQSGYWQIPVNPEDCLKTAFCSGPGMGLFQFSCMPFGLTGAPSTFQRLMNQIFRGLPYVTT